MTIFSFKQTSSLYPVRSRTLFRMKIFYLHGDHRKRISKSYQSLSASAQTAAHWLSASLRFATPDSFLTYCLNSSRILFRFSLQRYRQRCYREVLYGCKLPRAKVFFWLKIVSERIRISHGKTRRTQLFQYCRTFKNVFLLKSMFFTFDPKFAFSVSTT